jgi:hypothetical protein
VEESNRTFQAAHPSLVSVDQSPMVLAKPKDKDMKRKSTALMPSYPMIR